jgi:hypothetical protein
MNIFISIQIERLEEERLKLKQMCRQLARQAGNRAAELGFGGDSVWMDDNGIARPTGKLVDDAFQAASGEYLQQLKERDIKLDQFNRELNEKTNENRALITEIRGLEQGLKGSR